MKSLPIQLLFALLALLLCIATMRAQDDEGRIIFKDPKDAKKKVESSEDAAMLRRNAWGVDLMISEGGFGLGFFYHYAFTETITGLVATSFSEAKDPREFNIYTYYGEQIPLNKLNRIFPIPFFLGVQYRLFKDAIADNFRPYINGGAGPVFVYVTPYRDEKTLEDIEFFSSFKYGHPYYTYGGFIGFGAQFGSDRTTILGVNFRYYIIPLPGGIQGVLEGPKFHANGFFITLNFGATN